MTRTNNNKKKRMFLMNIVTDSVNKTNGSRPSLTQCKESALASKLVVLVSLNKFLSQPALMSNAFPKCIKR
jgi:hypothetical protein